MENTTEILELIESNDLTIQGLCEWFYKQGFYDAETTKDRSMGFIEKDVETHFRLFGSDIVRKFDLINSSPSESLSVASNVVINE